MPTTDWLKKEFHYGYDSGDVLASVPDETRGKEEALIGGSYRRVALEAMAPHLRPDSKAMELGPGRGSWTRALLKFVPQGQVHVFDFQDASRWLRPERYDGRLVCHKVKDNSFREAGDNSFDFFWSFGVLCHCNAALIADVLANSLAKLKPGGIAAHQYADWEKLERFGWEAGGVPLEFRDLPDDEIWWPRNSRDTMARMARDSGWDILAEDLDLVGRDGLILLRKPK